MAIKEKMKKVRFYLGAAVGIVALFALLGYMQNADEEGHRREVEAASASAYMGPIHDR